MRVVVREGFHCITINVVQSVIDCHCSADILDNVAVSQTLGKIQIKSSRVSAMVDQHMIDCVFVYVMCTWVVLDMYIECISHIHQFVRYIHGLCHTCSSGV